MSRFLWFTAYKRQESKFKKKRSRDTDHALFGVFLIHWLRQLKRLI